MRIDEASTGRAADSRALASVDSRSAIRIWGARTQNLQRVNVEIPLGQLVVVTGVSGSGKSSLVYDTLAAEGLWRLLETIDPGLQRVQLKLARPPVDLIEALPPILAIAQHPGSIGRRETLASLTEISGVLQALYATFGQPHCPTCDQPLSAATSESIAAEVLAAPERTRLMIVAPLVEHSVGDHRDVFERVQRDGFVRAWVDGTLRDVSPRPELDPAVPHSISAVIDRLVVKAGVEPRLIETIRTALRVGRGQLSVLLEHEGSWREHAFNIRLFCPACRFSAPALTPRDLSPQTTTGACATCRGLGILAEDATPSPPRRRGERVSPQETTSTQCPDCRGERLSPLARGTRFGGLRLPEFERMAVDAVVPLASRWLAAPPAAQTASGGAAQIRSPALQQHLLIELHRRLTALELLGLGYLTPDRPANTLSGGEFQRSRLACLLPGGHRGVLYVLDEPTRGLHGNDTHRLLSFLRELQQQGNTVVIVEHDLEVIAAADWVIELGPGAGRHGGQIMASGQPAALMSNPDSITGRWLSTPGTADRPLAAATAPAPPQSSSTGMVHCSHSGFRDLRPFTLTWPVTGLTCVTGVSGSGKSTLLMDCLAPMIRDQLAARQARAAKPFAELTGCDHWQRVVSCDQRPASASDRATPATVLGLWDSLRGLLAKTRDARLRGFSPRRFRFEDPAGRCPECRGRGAVLVKSALLPDQWTPCGGCHGQRFNPLTLSVRLKGRTAGELLSLTITEAHDELGEFRPLGATLARCVALGLGYLQLGQPMSSLSGGEGQRVKLAAALVGHDALSGPTCFVFDEPTTGLHPADVESLLQVMRSLTAAGHCVLAIEHNPLFIAAADWLIELGPGSGPAGGRVMGTGTSEQLMAIKDSPTGRMLRAHFR